MGGNVVGADRGGTTGRGEYHGHEDCVMDLVSPLVGQRESEGFAVLSI